MIPNATINTLFVSVLIKVYAFIISLRRTRFVLVKELGSPDVLLKQTASIIFSTSPAMCLDMLLSVPGNRKCITYYNH